MACPGSPNPKEDIFPVTQYLRQLSKACDEVANGSLSIRSASKVHKVSLGQLRHAFKGSNYREKIPLKKSKGPYKIFTKAEEQELIDYVINMYRCGFGRTRMEFMLKIQKTLNDLGRTTVLEDNMPTPEWFDLFLNGHKDKVKECIINFGTGEMGIIPVDVLTDAQTVVEEVVEPSSAGDAFNIAVIPQQSYTNQTAQHSQKSSNNSGNTYHHLTYQQTQQMLSFIDEHADALCNP